MSSNLSLDAEPDVLFVSTCSEPGATLLFEESFKACQDADIDPRRINEAECQKMHLKHSNNIFILDTFDSHVYKHLTATGSRILGAPCVLHCLKYSEDLPGNDHPVYSMCLKGAQVTLTGVPAAQRADAVEKIEWMGGVFTKSLLKSSTHLIAMEVSSQKYQVAVELGIPLLTMDWINDSYKKSKSQLFSATDKNYMAQFICPPFLGCVVTSSGVKQKDEIKDIVTKGGGLYTGQMTYKQCTHLVIEKPEGAKYKMARKWASLHIVNPLWVYDCSKIGYKLSEDNSKYSCVRVVSTPEREQFPLPNVSDVSAIQSTTLVCTHMDETTCSTNRRSLNDTSLNFAMKRNSSEAKLDKFTKCDALLKKKVCLRGFTDAVEEELCSVVSLCGGVRTRSTINAHYVVVSSLDSDTLQHTKDCSVPLVTSDWLREVALQQKLVSIDKYQLHQTDKNSSTGSDGSGSGVKRRISDGPLELPAAKRRPTDVDPTILDTETSNEATTASAEDMLLSQYMDTNTPPKDAGDLTPQASSSSLKRKSSAFVIPSTDTVKPSTSSDVSHIFSNLKLKLTDMEPSVRDELTLKVRSLRGQIVSSDSKADYHVLPLISKQHYELTNIDSKAVSPVWLRACDRRLELLSPDSNPLFKPYHNTNFTLFSGCSVSSTGLAAYERDALSLLVRSGGGLYTEDLRRHSTKEHPATTHLICLTSTDSNKYKAAISWGITTVSLSWITDSIKKESLQPTDQYSPQSKLNTDAASLTSKPVMGERRTLASLQTETPVHNRLKALKLASATSSGKKTPKVGTARYLSTSILDDPEKSFHPNFDLGLLDTPRDNSTTPNNKDDVETPLSEAMDKYITLAFEKHVDPSLRGRVPGEPSPSCHALDGMIIYVSKKLSSQAKELERMIYNLGAVYRGSYDSTATHVVFQGKASEGEYRSAKRNKQHIVCPYWLRKCTEEKRRVDERLYPYNYRPDKELGSIDINSCTPVLPKQSSKRVRGQLNLSNESEKCPTSSTKEHSVSTPANREKEQLECDDDMSEAKTVLQQITEYMSSRSFRKVPSVLTKTPTCVSTFSIKPSEDPSHQTDNQIAYPNTATTYTDSQVPEALVTWDDHTSRFEQEKLNNEAELNSEVVAEMEEDFTQEQRAAPAAMQELTADFTDATQITNAEPMDATNEEMAPKEKIFQFSGFNNAERDTVARSLEALGATVLTTSVFDDRCTHIILSKPVRNEKFLCALASGIWLLSKEYVQASTTAGHLVNEELYEWGGDGTSHLYNAKSSIAPYALAAKLRRVMAQSRDYIRPFTGWKVILCVSAPKLNTMERVLMVGGATVVAKGHLPDDNVQATHAFIEKKETVSGIHLEMLRGKEIKCARIEAIVACLIKENNDISEYLMLADRESR